MTLDLLLLIAGTALTFGEKPTDALPTAHPAGVAALRASALGHGLCGRETAWIVNFQSEANWCRNRLTYVYACPMLHWANALPKSDEIARVLPVIRQFTTHAVKSLEVCHASDEPILRSQVDAGWALLGQWTDMATARDRSRPWATRRRALEDLRRAIGDERFYRCVWPPPLPMETIPAK